MSPDERRQLEDRLISNRVQDSPALRNLQELSKKLDAEVTRMQTGSSAGASAQQIRATGFGEIIGASGRRVSVGSAVPPPPPSRGQVDLDVKVNVPALQNLIDVEVSKIVWDQARGVSN
jgi:hypothetical protein